ncbi:hypothetical protein Mal4_27130 [Maioricimonas rarisocia]|uniref:Uncharacterized protein n=1 Tax=Maioricimonas rarisocia TaxID=2528026 RepID=A0A517Z7C6_9PLAN|nr:hypothetical protein [Maioricimonas rarisocia]QDU38386.1 hypothetical protein Mal4_27130 [Maioricimonas rarisocia]
MSTALRPIATFLVLCTLFLQTERLAAQDDPLEPSAAADETAGPPALPEITDEPRTIDPASFLPEKLALPATVTFENATLREVADWIQAERDYPVILDERSLSDIGVLPSDPVSDRLDDAPLYLLLDRLQGLGLGWRISDDILSITTQEESESQLSTEQYLVGELLDAGFDADVLINVMMTTTSAQWLDADGIGGSIELLGDVLFVRQTASGQREVAALLAGLQKHGRMTFTNEPQAHLVLREKLERDVSVEFDNVPLAEAVRELSEATGSDIRLDRRTLREIGVRERQPVSLTISERPLRTVLSLLLSDLSAAWVLEDGVLKVTSEEAARDLMKTAIFDVRDLSRDDAEANALLDAVHQQTEGPWTNADGTGGNITFARPGTMVVQHSEARLQEVLKLLETYRAALKASKPRKQAEEDPNELITTYYRMEASTADDLENVLPMLVRPDSWETPRTPEGKGTIHKVASGSELRSGASRQMVAANGAGSGEALVVRYAVLIIHQTRAAHEEIAEIIRRVEQGDLLDASGEFEEFGGRGMGGGGFGGGYFSSPADQP